MVYEAERGCGGDADARLPSGGDDGAAPSPARILVVDDNLSNVRLLERMLHRAGYPNVISTTDPTTVLTAARDDRPDLVLLDLHMPAVSGFEILPALRAMVASDDFLPIVVVTADASRAARDRALDAGATDFITKPFDYSEVVLRVRNLLTTRALNHQLRARASRLEAEVSSERERRHSAERVQQAIEARVRRVLDGQGFDVAFQPIVNLQTGAVVGLEALARFEETPPRPPDLWFEDAHRVGLGVEAEICVVSRAIAKWATYSAPGYLAINLSPQALSSERLSRRLLASAAERLVVELTEHTAVDDYAELLKVRAHLKTLGVGLAIDDTGAGISSFQHVLRLEPDVIKLDRSLIQGLDRDPARRALTTALLVLSDALGAKVVAEGVETHEELHALQELGVSQGQGYLLRRPDPELPQALTLAVNLAALRERQWVKA